jgi:hypothetical protein
MSAALSIHDWRDGGSARSFDAAGRMHVTGNRLSRAAVNEYLGGEIPNAKALGLDPSKRYPLLRSPVELSISATSFNRLPIMRRHIPVNAAAPSAELIVGCVGSDVHFAMPFLVGSICLWDAAAISGVESEEVAELSAGYAYVCDMDSPGVFGGVKFVATMRRIQGNHLCVVPTGRAGSECRVAD